MDPVTINLALGLVAQGLSALNDFAARAAAGQITDADCQAMSDKLGLDIAALRADAAAAS